jgi:hypothetical protein
MDDYAVNLLTRPKCILFHTIDAYASLRNRQLPDISSGNCPILVTIQVALLLRRLRRQGEGAGRGQPAPRQGACQAPWNPLLNRYRYSPARSCWTFYENSIALRNNNQFN